MENDLKPKTTITKREFAVLHSKIQNKYEEMQKKLDKCKSMDTLTAINKDYFYTEDSEKSTSVNDLYKVGEKINKNSETQYVGPQIKMLDSPQIITTLSKDIFYSDAVINKSESISNISERCDSESESVTECIFFDKNYFKTSLESLNEVAKESDESSEVTTPPPQTLRSRIKSRLQKRREQDKINKEKRKQSKKKVEKYIFSNAYVPNEVLKSHKKIKVATVTIALVEVTGFEPIKAEEKPRVLIYRFRLGAEKHKSKLVKSHKDKVKFQELFSISLYDDDYILELTLFERDNLVGRNTIDLIELEKEKTHKIKLNFDNDYKNVQTFLLLTISGTTLINTVYDVDEVQMRDKEYLLRKKYAWYRLYGQFSDIGSLSVIVYGAKGLSGNDCHCILSLNNERIQTQTDYKTNEPSWMKIISFTVTDITSVLEVIIYDEKKSEEVGRVAIPLLNIKYGKRWYALKCCNLKDRAKGANPRVLLKINLTWNIIKAAYRVINPKEPNYLQIEEKLDRHIFAKNLSRAKVITTWILDALKVFKTCFQWESMKLNIVTLALWVTFCYNVRTWMLPLLLLIPFMWYKPEQYTLTNWKSTILKEFTPVKQTVTTENKEDKNISLRQKLNNLQEIIQAIQNIIGNIANLGESIKNLFNFTVPFLSLLTIFIILIIAFVMYLIPFNYICMFWGIYKFLKKIIFPNRIPNNELMDLLSRVPDDEILNSYEELPLGNISEDNTSE